MADATHRHQQHLQPRDVLQKRVNLTPESAGSILTTVLVVVGCAIGIGVASIAVFGFEWKIWTRGVPRQEHIDGVSKVGETGENQPSTDQNGRVEQDENKNIK
ncbi:uncharacterized protein PpBr36_10536 [Pyricularia pennisetigena]|uniref:uncharacterized protein n=1 Tax=Pyricularia pennisetigena TaxID=1578925 RepID=UPI001152DD35|nr:uncharacterized protein PpBr36_10536 [Pyricularia pennisetigena]TLS21147.1 hypothetical protein PpBr36_10536 [Pyricularia pennisetigena]